MTNLFLLCRNCDNLCVNNNTRTHAQVRYLFFSKNILFLSIIVRVWIIYAAALGFPRGMHIAPLYNILVYTEYYCCKYVINVGNQRAVFRNRPCVLRFCRIRLEWDPA